MHMRKETRQCVLTISSMVILAIGSTIASGESIEQVLEKIRTAQEQIETVQCRVITEATPPPQADPESALERLLADTDKPPMQIAIHTPDKYRVVIEHRPEYHSVNIHNGNHEWTQQGAHSVYHSMNHPSPTVLLCAPIVYIPQGGKSPFRSSSEPHLDNVLRKPMLEGVEEIDGEPCYVLTEGLGSKRMWISTRDGLIRRQQVWSEGLTRTTTYTQVVMNEPVDPAQFIYDPKPGTRVQEFDWSRPENERRRNYQIPFAVVTDDQQSVAVDKRDQVEALFAQHKRFLCRYHERREGYGSGVTIDDRGNQIRSSETTKGHLVIESPTRLRIELVTKHDAYHTTERLCVIAGGQHAWRWTDRLVPPSNAKRTVFKDRVVPPGQALPHAQRAAMLRGELVTDNGYEVTRRECPFYVLHPLGGIPKERLVFSGENELDGQPVWVFTALETDRENRSDHWIGTKDGIPRQILVYTRDGQTVDTTIRLTDIKINEEISGDTFTYNVEPDDNLVDYEAQRQAKEKKFEQVKKEMGESVEERAYRSIVKSPPFEQARNVRYDGVFAMSYAWHLRFETDQPATFTGQEDLKPNDQEGTAGVAAWFLELIPKPSAGG